MRNADHAEEPETHLPERAVFCGELQQSNAYNVNDDLSAVQLVQPRLQCDIHSSNGFRSAPIWQNDAMRIFIII